ncbi:60S ribosomal export protein NMD3 [Sulfodiicoccus acidiphilus]|nr:60S ribosomal export protein NMD3 [Sulfodiicoccus acidiphilus]
MTRFCVSCGREGVQLVGSLCPSCYVERTELIKFPDEVEVRRCRFCGSSWFDRKWVKLPEQEVLAATISQTSLIDHNISSLKIEASQIRFDPKEGKVVEVTASGHVHGAGFRLNRSVRLTERNVTCDSCLKKRGKKYEVVVQLRGKEGKLDEGVKRLFEESLDKEALDNLCDVVSLREGVDYYFISKSVGKRVVSRFSQVTRVWVTESHEGERVRDGRRESKLILAVRA